MKAQLSLEMQLYLTLAMIAAVFSFHEFTIAYPSINGMFSRYMVEKFIGVMDSSIMYGNVSFNSYIPKGMCNATVKGTTLETRYGTFHGTSRIFASGKPFCPDTAYATLYLAYLQNGTVEVSR